MHMQGCLPRADCRNLDAFQGSENILDHHLHVDASRVVQVDGDAIPTGEFINVTGTPWDFTTPHKIDYRFNETVGLCGAGEWCRGGTLHGRARSDCTLYAGCIGYDHCWIYDRSEEAQPGVSLWSDVSGIR